MKELLLMVLFAGGVYLFMVNQSEEVNTVSYQDLLKKLENSDVSLDEVKSGANVLAQYFCNDVTFQTTGLSTVSGCMDRYQNAKKRCEDQVFGNAPETFTDKEQVVILVKKFTDCSGVL